jgi:hypothetical protein
MRSEGGRKRRVADKGLGNRRHGITKQTSLKNGDRLETKENQEKSQKRWPVSIFFSHKG